MRWYTGNRKDVGKFRFALFSLDIGNIFNHEHFSHCTILLWYLCKIFISPSENVRLPTWVRMYISYHFFLFLVISFPLSWKFEEKKKTTFYCWAMNCLLFLFFILILFWVQVSKSVPMSLAGFCYHTLLISSCFSLVEKVLRTQFWDWGTCLQSALFWYFCRGCQ